MKFGLTTAERQARNKAKIRALNNPYHRFAWLPVRLDDGRCVWLERYWEVRSRMESWVSNELTDDVVALSRVSSEREAREYMESIARMNAKFAAILDEK